MSRPLVSSILPLIAIGLSAVIVIAAQFLWIFSHPEIYEDFEQTRVSLYAVEGTDLPASNEIRTLIGAERDKQPPRPQYMFPVTAHRLSTGTGTILASRTTRNYPFRGLIVTDSVETSFELMTVYLPGPFDGPIELVRGRNDGPFAILTSASISYWNPVAEHACFAVAAEGRIVPYGSRVSDIQIADVYLKFETPKAEEFESCPPVVAIEKRLSFDVRDYDDLGLLEGKNTGPVVEAEYVHLKDDNILLRLFPLLLVWIED